MIFDVSLIDEYVCQFMLLWCYILSFWLYFGVIWCELDIIIRYFDIVLCNFDVILCYSIVIWCYVDVILSVFVFHILLSMFSVVIYCVCSPSFPYCLLLCQYLLLVCLLFFTGSFHCLLILGAMFFIIVFVAFHCYCPCRKNQQQILLERLK